MGAAGKRLLHGAACKHRQCGPPLLSFLFVGNNTNNTGGAKDTPEQRISKAFYALNQTLTLCESVFGSECMSVCRFSVWGNRGPLCDHQGGLGPDSRPECKTPAV